MPFKLTFKQFEARYKRLHKESLRLSGAEVVDHGWQDYAAKRIGVSRQVVSQWKMAQKISERGLLLIKIDIDNSAR